MKTKLFALVDCNNFYVSCERSFDTSIRERPVIVMSNNDGCVIARSNEVKRLGVKMGQPIFQIQGLIKQHNIHLFSSNFSLYGDMSERVMQVFDHDNFIAEAQGHHIHAEFAQSAQRNGPQ